MTAMTADYQRGYRAGLKAAKGDTIRDKDARAVMVTLACNETYINLKSIAKDAFLYADAMEVEP